MTRVVHKYEMPEPGWTLHYDIPAIHKPLTVQMQGEKIMLWCEVTLFGQETKETRVDFWTVPTGQPIPSTR